MRKSTTISGLSLIALSMILSSCGQTAQQQSRSEKNYNVLTVNYGNTSLNNKYSASIQGEQFVEIRPQISGIITKILINEGAKVKKDQLLFVIDQTTYKAAADVALANVKSAEADVATAKLNAESSKNLFSENVISKVELQTYLNTLASAEADLALAQAELISANNDLSYTEIKSPVDGVASMIAYREGALVSSSITDPLVSVVNNTNMYAYFSMSESQILSLTQESGSTAQLIEDMSDIELILNNGSKYEHKGKVDAISGTVDRSTGAVTMRAIFENPNQILRDGGNGNVIISTQKDSVIIVPKVATFELQNKNFAYKVVDGKTSSVEISLYPMDNGKEFIVESGLNIGDVIIAEGAGLLRDGMEINKTTDVSKATQVKE